MAKPRVFVSSTYYDLKHVRSSLDLFIESFGYESVLSEKGNIAYAPDTPLDESCYREVTNNTDIFVLIIGGRYGSEVSSGNKLETKEFYDRYESVTKKEFEEAIKQEIPTYILIEQNVYSEYQTFLVNKNNSQVVYAHVDSVNIFKFIEKILLLPKNNPIHTFERFIDIEFWLKEQWAGLFRELLKRMAEQKQFAQLSFQVEELKSVNGTLKSYLELVMKNVAKADESEMLIKVEEEKLSRRRKIELIRQNHLSQYLNMRFDIKPELLIEYISEVNSVEELVETIIKNCNVLEEDFERLKELFLIEPKALEDLNDMRSNIGLKKLKIRHKK